MGAMNAPAAVPPLVEREKPGLSETLTAPKSPDRCQSCGAPEPTPNGNVDATIQRFGLTGLLERWMECDPWDRDTHVVVVLCQRCSARLISPHPRLYKALPPS